MIRNYEKEALKKYEALKIYELMPTDLRQSFYGKAKVICCENNSEILISYETPVMIKYSDGKMKKLWDGWSNTTGRHIFSFCGLRKKQLDQMELNNVYSMSDLKW